MIRSWNKSRNSPGHPYLARAQSCQPQEEQLAPTSCPFPPSSPPAPGHPRGELPRQQRDGVCN